MTDHGANTQPSRKPYHVYGVGNALVDIQARVADSVLESLQFAKGIMTLVDEPTQQRVLESLNGSAISRCAGGSAANTIMGIADLGGRAAFACKVGNEEIGQFFLEDMKNMGVNIAVPPAESGQSGTCVVLITDDAERTMLTHLGVSATLSESDIHEEEIAKSEYIYVEGYLLTADNTKAAALKAIEIAKRHGVQVALTVSDPFLVSHFKDDFWNLIEGPVDLLFCNIDEARSLCDTQDAIECARIIHRHAANVALTMGELGSILMVEDSVIPIEGVPTKAIDTTGAGDMYAAGLLYGITSGLTWRQSGHLASQAASRIVSQMGARLARPFTVAEIHQLTQM